jgi:hypothetical protein
VSVFLFYFGWPDGAVYSNLLASAICVTVTLAVVHKLYDLRRIHARLKRKV